MPAYRVELAKGGQAGCRATHCKKEGTKCKKGDLRQGTLVTIEERSSFHWRHWGCVTPEVLNNWSVTCEGDMELVDGFEELPQDMQDKVQTAIELKHVDDEDWNGDLEMNRYDPTAKGRGMFIKTPKGKKAKGGDDSDELEPTPSKKKPAKKRGRAATDDDEDDDDEPAPKKAKAKPRKKAAVKTEDDADEADEAPKKQPAKRGKKAKDSVVDEVEATPAPKAKKGRKAKSEEVIADSESIHEDEPAPPKKGRAKKAAAADVADAQVDGPAEPPKKRRGRPKKATAEDA